MPRYTPAQRRALAGDPEFADEFREPDPEVAVVGRFDEQEARVGAEREHERRAEWCRPALLTMARAVVASCDRDTAPAEVVDLVTAMAGLGPGGLVCGGRDQRTTEARMVASYVLREVCRVGWVDAGAAIGSSHSGTLAAARRLSAAMGAA